MEETKPKQTRGHKFHWILDAESMRLPPDVNGVGGVVFHCQFVYMPAPHPSSLSSGLCPARSWPVDLSTLACPPGSADGVIYCYQTLEHIKHFITCQSAASNNFPAGAASQTKRRQRRRERGGKRRAEKK